MVADLNIRKAGVENVARDTKDKAETDTGNYDNRRSKKANN